MKWIRRIFLALFAIITVLILALVATVVIDLNFGAKASDFTNSEFLAEDGSTLHGYLALPEAEGTYPAVIMIHEWWGMNAEISEMAERLAEEGYVVFAPDTYRGATTNLVPSALYLRLNVPESRVNSDVQAAYTYLSSLPQVDASRIAIIGFCYGGGVALRHAIENPNIAATVNLYGDTISNPADFGTLLESGQPVLGIFGAEDAQIPVAEVQSFEAALNAAAIENTVTIYEGVGHAFVNPSTIDTGGAAAEAWAQILAFFETHLKA